jgi:hypothetical protein
MFFDRRMVGPDMSHEGVDIHPSAARLRGSRLPQPAGHYLLYCMLLSARVGRSGFD